MTADVTIYGHMSGCVVVHVCSDVCRSKCVGIQATPWLSQPCSNKTPSPRASVRLLPRIHPSRPPCCDMCQCRSHQFSDQGLWGTGLKSETRGHSYPSAHDSKTALCVEPNNSRRVTTLLRMFMSSVALTSMSCGEKSGMVKREGCREGEWGFFGDCHC